ncbi:transporter substrate-binding domain-containing protein [Chitinivorax sp. B]|uniref:substrate-binding periplasmic protein n=1 Tax=Chitinivorax sp. B TaxID=2502235 RepID=UPI0010F9D301|nr:transporter substrate-binding domain-containing protein [Chitinivorax sp. B]
MSPWQTKLLIALVALAPGWTYAADTTVTLLIDDAYPPYAYKQNDKAAGIYPDVLRMAASKLKGFKVELVPKPWKRALAEVEAGMAMGVVPPYYRPIERPWIRPYSVPILEERVVVFCRREMFSDSPRLRWPDDYRGLTFGNNMGFVLGGQPFWTAVQMGLITVQEAPGSRTNLTKLINKRIDCYLNDRLAILSEIAQMRRDGIYDDIKHAHIQEGATISIENGHIGYSSVDGERFAHKDEFVKQMDAILTLMRQSGDIQRIVDQYTR